MCVRRLRAGRAAVVGPPRAHKFVVKIITKINTMRTRMIRKIMIRIRRIRIRRIRIRAIA